MGFLPDNKQASVALRGMKINRRGFQRRKETVAKAKTFVDTFVLKASDGSDLYKDVAYLPNERPGVGYITGGARVAISLMYGLYMRAPNGSIVETIDWVLEQTPEVLAGKTDWDLGRAKEGRRVGEVTQAAYQLAVQYFEYSLLYANRQWRAEYRAKRREAQRSQRARGYRTAARVTRANGPGMGNALNGNQRDELLAAAASWPN